ncbi:MAG: tetratricopeptide repeat-containing sensor histidine kinase [Bacteroidales bacterium]|nr:tetratricopeptide repeat-containing sensor histidine kinase [Bacteroidales bacterium]MDT8430900.1 tetratricopeptide repeat-containing sensor histidine kinase [Bacteroidales bacterium]
MRITLFVIIVLLIAIPATGQQGKKIEHITSQLAAAGSDSTRVRLLTELALEYKTSDTARAFALIEQARELATGISDDRGTGLCYAALGKIRYFHGDYNKALRDFESAKSWFHRSGLQGKYADVMVDQGNAHLFLSQYDIALSKYDSARRVFSELDHTAGLIRCLNNMGIIYKNYGRYREAIDSYAKVIELSLRDSDSISLTDTYINIGVVHVKQGDYHTALENFSRSLYYARQTGNRKQESISLMNSGVIYNKLQEYGKALEHYNKALSVSEQMGDKVEISRCLTNIGTNYIPMGQYELAETYIRRGLDIKQELGETRSIANAYNFLAEIEYYRENYMEAIELDLHAIELKHEVNDPEGLARCFSNLGRTYLAAGKPEEAFRYADSSLFYGLSIGALEHITSAYFIQKEVMEQFGNYRHAFELYDLYKKYSDSLMNEYKARAVKEIEFRYESRVLEEKNEQLQLQAELDAVLIERNRKILITLIPAIILFALAFILLYTIQRRQKQYNAALTQQNQIITRQNIKLDEYNRTKDKILSVITHDIRGTIGNQLTALSVLAKDEFRDEEERTIVLSRLANSAALSLGMLENLALWTRLREGSLEFTPKRVRFSSLVDEVLQDFSRSVFSKEIRLQVEKSGPMDCYVDSHLIRIVLANLVSNAIKYSYRGGEVIVSAQQQNSHVVVEITDKGIGMTEGELMQCSESSFGKGRRGTENEKGSGLGLSLARSILGFHDSELRLKSTAEAGTTASFILQCGAH